MKNLLTVLLLIGSYIYAPQCFAQSFADDDDDGYIDNIAVIGITDKSVHIEANARVYRSELGFLSCPLEIERDIKCTNDENGAVAIIYTSMSSSCRREFQPYGLDVKTKRYRIHYFKKCGAVNTVFVNDKKYKLK